MAQPLSMEDLIKKYKFLTSNQRTHTDSNQQQQQQQQETVRSSHKTDSLKSSSLSADGGPGATVRSRSVVSNVPIESIGSLARNIEDACKVCMDAEVNCAFIDCGHIVTCLDCAKMLTRCPLCRQTIKRTLRIYKS